MRRPAPTQVPFIRVGTGLAALLLLSACSMEGDFGRPKRGVVLASIAEPMSMGSEPSWSNDEGFSEPESDVGTAEPGSVLPLTAEEIQLREAAYRLRVQVQNLMPIGVSANTENAYAEHLTRQGYLHGPSRLAKIEHEIRTDHDALSKFAHAARVVLGGDRVRMGAAFDRRTSLTGSDKHDAHARVGENMLVIRRTFADIERRIAAYDYAIDRTRIETPVLATGHAKSGLNHLRDRAASLQYELIEAQQAAHRIARYGSKARPAPGPVDIRPPGRRRGKQAAKPSK